MHQTLNLIGNEFYVIEDLYEDLMQLPKGWNAAVGDGIKMRASSDKDKGRVKITGEILTVKFTLTVHKDSAFLITDNCSNLKGFVYDIEGILRAGIHKGYPDIEPLSEAEAKDWVNRCVGSSEGYATFINNVKGLVKPDIYSKAGWLCGEYRMAVKRVQDNDPLLTAFAEIYGGDELFVYYMLENSRNRFCLVVRDDALYYDSKRAEYLAKVFTDIERITGKLTKRTLKDHNKIKVGI